MGVSKEVFGFKHFHFCIFFLFQRISDLFVHMSGDFKIMCHTNLFYPLSSVTSSKETTVFWETSIYGRPW